MEPIAYRIKNSKRFTLIGKALFFILVCLFFGAVLFFGENGDQISTSILLVLMSVFYCLAGYNLLLAFMSRLFISEQGIGYQKFLHLIFYSWQDFYYIDINNKLLALYYRPPSKDPATKPDNSLIRQSNFIPISNFINEWGTEDAWKSDPLLVTLDLVFHLNKGNSEEPVEEKDLPTDQQIYSDISSTNN
jgi:hypothetical protein